MEVLYGGGIVVGITILIEGLKSMLIPKRFRWSIPLIAIVFGIICSFLNPDIQYTYPEEPTAYEIIIDGILMGLAAIGVHQVGKKTVLRKIHYDEKK